MVYMAGYPAQYGPDDRLNGDELVYRSSWSKKEAMGVMRAVAVPVGVFGLALFTIANLGAFGTRLLCPLISVMWVWGVFVALVMPSMRGEVLHQTLTIIGLYCAAILGLKLLLGVVSGVSSEMIGASFNQAIPTATGNAIPGYLQNIMWWTAVGVPISFIVMQAKRLRDFRRSQTLTRAFGQARDMRGLHR